MCLWTRPLSQERSLCGSLPVKPQAGAASARRPGPTLCPWKCLSVSCPIHAEGPSDAAQMSPCLQRLFETMSSQPPHTAACSLLSPTLTASLSLTDEQLSKALVSPVALLEAVRSARPRGVTARPAGCRGVLTPA